VLFSEERHARMATMTGDSSISRMLSLVLDRFPYRRQTILSLSLRDQLFRSLLDDLVLAHETLQQFEARPDADQRPEIAEYRTIIRELEDDVRAYLAGSNSQNDPTATPPLSQS
jgi:hypothetical protein